jgi:hydrogenase nickel incorporation protein HypA/HybF
LKRGKAVHELSIAMSILEMAEDEAERRGGVRIDAIYLKLGALSGVVEDALQSSYEIASYGSALNGSRLLIENVPVTVYCPNCCMERQLKTIQNFSCPDCGVLTPQVVHGRELEVTALEISE